MTVPLALEDQIADLYRRIAELERRVQNKRRTGVVTEVDAAKGLARVRLSEDPETGRPYVSGWIPWREAAMGDIRTHVPPSVGQQVDVVGESGDGTDWMIDQALPSDQIARPHDKAGEWVVDMHSGKYRKHCDAAGNQAERHAKTCKRECGEDHVIETGQHHIIRTGGICYINTV